MATLAQRKRTSRPSSAPTMGEIGFGGAKQLKGWFAEEYLPDLSGQAFFGVIDKMRRSDSMISALEQVLTLPIRSAEWRIDAPKDAAGSMAEAQKHIEDNLFGGMTITWDDLLRQLLLSLFYGFTFAEKVFELKDGKVAWRKIAPRKPATRWRWLLDEHGGIEGVDQRGWGPPGWLSKRIPVDKLLVMTFRNEFGNHDGFSILRPAYKHWLMRDALYQKYNLGVDKSLLPILVGRVPERDMGSSRATDFGGNLASIYATSGAHFILPAKPSKEAAGYDIETVPADGTFQGILEMIEHHGRGIVVTALAQFLTLGSDATGSYALSADQSDFFLMSLNATAGQVCDLFNNYAIPQLCDYNWPGMTEYPKLAVQRIRGIDLDVVSQALSTLSSSGFVRPGVQDEAVVRDLMHLPEIPEDQVKKREEMEADAIENPAMDPVTGKPLMPGQKPNMPAASGQPGQPDGAEEEKRQSAIDKARAKRRGKG